MTLWGRALGEDVLEGSEMTLVESMRGRHWGRAKMTLCVDLHWSNTQSETVASDVPNHIHNSKVNSLSWVWTWVGKMALKKQCSK